jgi:hypothetical protein
MILEIPFPLGNKTKNTETRVQENGSVGWIFAQDSGPNFQNNILALTIDH